AQASSCWRPGRPSQVVAYAKAYRSGRSTNEGQRGRSQPTGRSSAGRQELGATQQPFTPSTCSACRHWQASFGSSPRSSMIIWLLAAQHQLLARPVGGEKRRLRTRSWQASRACVAVAVTATAPASRHVLQDGIPSLL